jgi:Ca2+-dependent lipid-binding protein
MLMHPTDHYSMFFFSVHRNQTFELLVFDKEVQQIEFVLYDEDVVNNECLGRAVLHLDTLQEGVQSDMIDLSLMDVDTGSLQVTCLYTPLGQAAEEMNSGSMEDLTDILYNMSPAVLNSDILTDDSIRGSESRYGRLPPGRLPSESSLAAASEHQKVSMKAAASAVVAALPKTQNKITGGVLSISTISCSRLRNNSTTYGGGLRPYVTFQVGSIVKQTKVQRDHTDPTFDETFHIVVQDPRNAVIQVKVMDQFKFMKDQCIGEVSIRVIDVVSNPNGLLKEHRLESRQGECSITCKLSWVQSA